jgi:hypothetical protein
VAVFTRTVHDIPLARIVDLVSTLRQLCANSAHTREHPGKLGSRCVNLLLELSFPLMKFNPSKGFLFAVPGSFPVLGAAAAFSFSRRIRRRIKGASGSELKA